MEIYPCGVNYTVKECWDNRATLQCCPADSYCTQWRCVSELVAPVLFISMSKLVWWNVVAQLVVLLAGLVDFLLSTAYYRLRRRRVEQRIERVLQTVNTMINEEMVTVNAHKPLLQLSELSGRCCGCGEVADTVLRPCHHAVCCHLCSPKALFCPFCKAACTSQQRLYPV